MIYTTKKTPKQTAVINIKMPQYFREFTGETRGEENTGREIMAVKLCGLFSPCQPPVAERPRGE